MPQIPELNRMRRVLHTQKEDVPAGFYTILEAETRNLLKSYFDFPDDALSLRFGLNPDGSYEFALILHANHIRNAMLL